MLESYLFVKIFFYYITSLITIQILVELITVPLNNFLDSITSLSIKNKNTHTLLSTTLVRKY